MYVFWPVKRHQFFSQVEEYLFIYYYMNHYVTGSDHLQAEHNKISNIITYYYYLAKYSKS